jgi:YegS/Rv2252/BmrU family lipid kinase
MSKALLIYNPVSGRGRTLTYLDHLIDYFESKNIGIIPLQTPYSEETLFSLLEGSKYIFVVGGDGTLNMVLNSIIKYQPRPPLGIVPTGTANNFASNLGLRPLNSGIKDMNLNGSFFIDVGKVDSYHFITAALGGHLIARWHGVDQKLKNNLGMLAYYLEGILKGITEMPKLLKTIEIEVVSAGKHILHGEVFLFLIFNGKDAANFSCLAPHASLTDGVLDCIFFRKCSPGDFLNLLFKVMTGNHIQDNNVLYLQAENLRINGPSGVMTDLDGEKGPPFPWEVNVLPRRLEVLNWQIGQPDIKEQQDMETKLLELPIGQAAVIKRIEGGYGFQRRLASLGIRVGQTVRKVGSGPFKGPVVVEVDRARVAIGKGMAMKVIVEELQA